MELLEKLISHSKRFTEHIKDEIIRIIVPFVTKYWRDARRLNTGEMPGEVKEKVSQVMEKQ